MLDAPLHDKAQPDTSAVLTRAVIKAADHLAISPKILSKIIGLSEATVSRMRHGDYALSPTTKPFEIGVLFIRLFRSLDALVGGDATVAQGWLNNPNTALNGTPIEKLQTISGLVEVIAYLDARRAIL